MTKQEIIRQLERAWGEIPGWMNGWSRESQDKYLQRLSVMAETTEGWGHALAIGAMPRELENKLGELWPEMAEMAYYPA